MRPADQAFQPHRAALAAASDADRVVSGASGQLNYLSQVSVSLGLPDPVQEYFGPLVGRWRELHDQAELWRRAADSVEDLASQVTAPLGRLDAVWHGRVSDSFLEHLRQVGQASTSAADAMAAMADVLDTTAEAMHQLVSDTVDLLAGGADRVSLALLLPSGGEARAGAHLGEIRMHGRRMLESVHELLEALATMLAGFDDSQPFARVVLTTTYPAQNWTFQPDLPAVPPTPAADPVGSSAATGSSGGGGGGGAGGGGGLGGVGSGSVTSSAGPPEPALRTFAMEPGTAGTATGQSTAGTTPAVAGAAGAARGGAGGLGMGMMPMAGMGAGQGGDTDRRATSGLTADPADIFGEPSKTAPAVIGED